MAEQEIPIGLKDFPALRELGKGAFGKVFAVSPSARVKAKLAGRNRAGSLQLKNGCLLAMKQLSKAKACAGITQIRSTRTENAMLQQLRGSRFCLRHFCSFQTPSHLYLVTEYYSGGSLLDYLRGTQKTIRGPFLVYLAAELVAGLQFIHGKGIVHRDLKPANIMITGKGHVVIVDFGLAMYKDNTREARRIVGTYSYRAPETYGLGDSVPYREMLDWWSLGVTLLEARAGQNPYKRVVPRPKDSQQERRRKLAELQQGPNFWDDICPGWNAFRSFIGGLLHLDPQQRLGANLGAEEVKGHRLFSLFFPTPAHWQRLEKHQLPPPVSGRNAEEFLCPRESPAPIPVETGNLHGLVIPGLFQGFNVPPTSLSSDEEDHEE